MDYPYLKFMEQKTYSTSKCNRGHIEIILVPREDTIDGYKANRDQRACHTCQEEKRRPFIYKPKNNANQDEKASETR